MKNGGKKPILKVVRGNRERRKEVIEILENLGGKNVLGCVGKCDTSYYYINPNRHIEFRICEDSFFSNYELEIIELRKLSKNEQKAKEIADKMIIQNQTNIEADVAIRHVVDACIKMAKWKDKQFNDFFEMLVNDAHQSGIDEDKLVKYFLDIKEKFNNKN